MWTLARKILLHDRIKFVVAAAGVSVSVWLVLVQVGLYFGFMENASTLIDHAHADLWVTGAGNENFDFASPIDDKHSYLVAQTPGVARSERMILAFGQFELDSGGTQGVEVVGLERDAALLRPWNVVAGDDRRLADATAIVVDRTEHQKIGVRDVGERREITGARSRVVALTDGIRSFTTSPFVFTNLDSARAYTRLGPEQLTYVLVAAEPGTDLAALEERLDAIPGVDAFTKPAFSARARDYWSSRTGVGAGFFMTAIMGVLVGSVVVGQILYNGTLEHLKEYGTLKAMGVPASGIVKTILYQALLSAAVGYVAGGALAAASRHGMRAANLNLVLSPGLLAATAGITVVMCMAAAVLSVLKVLRLDPASVFKG
jgi:putative ABC transport system permease protein